MGVSQSTCQSRFVLCLSLKFSGLSRLFFGDFPDLPFSSFLAFQNKSTYKEHSRKGPRHNQDLSRKKLETPGLETPRLMSLLSNKGSGRPWFGSVRLRFPWAWSASSGSSFLFERFF